MKDEDFYNLPDSIITTCELTIDKVIQYVLDRGLITLNEVLKLQLLNTKEEKLKYLQKYISNK